jgi:hypothetical protein
MRDLAAPKAARTAISRCRCAPRASSRFAKLAQAISKIMATCHVVMLRSAGDKGIGSLHDALN